MNCEQLRDHYELYALGIAEQPERGEIREHLARRCEVCGAGVKRALETAALVGASAPPAQPSAQLRRAYFGFGGIRRTAIQRVVGVGGRSGCVAGGRGLLRDE